MVEEGGGGGLREGRWPDRSQVTRSPGGEGGRIKEGGVRGIKPPTDKSSTWGQRTHENIYRKSQYQNTHEKYIEIP